MPSMETIPGRQRPGWGADADPALRPGVPMLHPPTPVKGAHWTEPEPQPQRARLERERPPRWTPVFGTAQPIHGPVGRLRRRAYAVPEHRATHWMLLLLADRMEAWSDSIRRPSTWLWGLAGFGAMTAARRLGGRRVERSAGHPTLPGSRGGRRTSPAV